ncbi:MAG: hypothetical protein HY080_02295, partial [Gammaproteobacteria bacterium]|nr:hypothetical protein [Gammaproteobacteria bacterium]
VATPIKKYGMLRTQHRLLSEMKTAWPNLSVLTDVTAKDYFTPEWKEPAVHAKAVVIDARALLKELGILQQELRKYPTAVIDCDLEAIALSSKLSLYDIDYGGTTIRKRIYLTVKRACFCVIALVVAITLWRAIRRYGRSGSAGDHAGTPP